MGIEIITFNMVVGPRVAVTVEDIPHVWRELSIKIVSGDVPEDVLKSWIAVDEALHSGFVGLQMEILPY